MLSVLWTHLAFRLNAVISFGASPLAISGNEASPFRCGAVGYCQTNRFKHQKPGERGFYEAIRERHSVRAASRLSLKVLRVDSDLCELK